MRINKLRKSLRKDGRLPYLVTDLNNIRYLTGFNGTHAGLIVDHKKSYFISDSRYSEYAESILGRSVEFVLQQGEFNKSIKQVIKDTGNRNLFLEDHTLPLSAFMEMKKKLRGIKLIPSGSEVNNIRIVKDESEIELLRDAAAITDSCVEHLLKIIKPGMAEWDIATEIESFYRSNGCTGTSFSSIVGSGSGTSMPHYETSMKKKIERGDVVLIDMGCVYRGYNSDLTRTIFMNSVEKRMSDIYSIVKRAQEAAVMSVRPGITTGSLDSIARNIISDEGYGDMFGHSLGHGVGVEVHELPPLKTGGEMKLKKNMVITIEPGIYIPGLGGVRIEDMVLVTAEGREVLTKSTKEIIILN